MTLVLKEIAIDMQGWQHVWNIYEILNFLDFVMVCDSLFRNQ
jgi:hypothetical protein